MSANTHRSAFIMTPVRLLERRHLSPLARLVWIRLMAHRNRGNGQCNPTHAKLAEELDVSVHRIRRAVPELRRAGLLSGTNKCGRGNWYSLCEPAVFSQPVEAEEIAESTYVSTSCIRKDAQAACANMHRLPAHQCSGKASASLYEPDVINQKKEHDAAVEYSGVVEPAQTAAAAPPAVVQKLTTPRPTPAPAPCAGQSSETSGQLDLGLEPVDPMHAQAAALVEELHADHPQPGLPDKAVAEVERILRTSDDPAAVIATMRANHAAWKAHWEMLRPGQFIPQLWRWFRDGEWKRAVRKPARRETFFEREERKWKENENSEHRIWMREYEAEQERKRLRALGLVG